MSRRSREKDRGCGTEEICLGEGWKREVGQGGGGKGENDRREGGMAERTVRYRSAAIDFAVAHATSVCIHPSRPSRFVGLASERASERAAIN